MLTFCQNIILLDFLAFWVYNSSQKVVVPHITQDWEDKMEKNEASIAFEVASAVSEAYRQWKMQPRESRGRFDIKGAVKMAIKAIGRGEDKGLYYAVLKEKSVHGHFSQRRLAFHPEPRPPRPSRKKTPATPTMICPSKPPVGIPAPAKPNTLSLPSAKPTTKMQCATLKVKPLRRMTLAPSPYLDGMVRTDHDPRLVAAL